MIIIISFSSKVRTTALQSIFSLAKSFDYNNWKDHVSEAMSALLVCSNVRTDSYINGSLIDIN